MSVLHLSSLAISRSDSGNTVSSVVRMEWPVVMCWVCLGACSWFIIDSMSCILVRTTLATNIAAVPRVQTQRIFKPGLFSLPISNHCIKNNHSNFISNDKLNTTESNQKPPRPIETFLNWTKSKQEQAFTSSWWFPLRWLWIKTSQNKVDKTSFQNINRKEYNLRV